MAENRPVRGEERLSGLVRAQKYGVTILTQGVSIGFFISELKRIYDLQLDLLNVGYLVLLALLVLLVWFWITATDLELGLLGEWVETDKYVPPSGQKEFAIIIGLALLLGGLLFAARNPFWFGLVFTFYNIADLLSGWHRDKNELAPAFQDSKGHFIRLIGKAPPDRTDAAIRLEGVRVLERYHCVRPQTGRNALKLGFSVVGLILATRWWQTQDAVWGFASYMLFVLIIVVSEAVIFSWRFVRDRDLREVRGRLPSQGVEPP